MHILLKCVIHKADKDTCFGNKSKNKISETSSIKENAFFGVADIFRIFLSLNDVSSLSRCHIPNNIEVQKTIDVFLHKVVT